VAQFRISDLTKGKSRESPQDPKSKATPFQIANLYNKTQKSEPHNPKENIDHFQDQEKVSGQQKIEAELRLTDMLIRQKIQNSPASHPSSQRKKTPFPHVPDAKPEKAAAQYRKTQRPKPLPVPRPTPHSSQNSYSPTPGQQYSTQASKPFIPHGPSSNKLSLRDSYNFILRFNWLLFISIIAACCYRIIPSLNVTYPYKSTAKIIYEHQNTQFDSSQTSSIVVYADTVIRMARKDSCYQITHRVLQEKLNQKQHHQNEKEWIQNIAPRSLSSHLSIHALGANKDILYIRSQHPHSPQLSILLANSYASAVLEELETFTKKSYSKQLTEINKNIDQNKKNIDYAENELNLLLDPEEGLKLDNSNARLLQIIEKKQALKRERELYLFELSGMITGIRKRLGLKPPQTVSDIVWVNTESKLYQKYQSLKLAVEEMKFKHLSNSPERLKLQKEYLVVKKALFTKKTPTTIFLNVNSENTVAVKSLEAQMKKKSDAELEIQSLQQQIKKVTEKLVLGSEEQNRINKIGSRMDYLNLFKEKLHETKRQIGILMLSIHTGYSIMEWATSSAQNKPKIPWISHLFQGIAIGLLASICLAFLVYHFENTPKFSIDIIRKVKIKVVGVTPQWENDDKILSHLDLETKKGSMYSIIRQNIRFCSPNNIEGILFLTSPQQNDGKSLTATNLAISYALDKESCILVSADLRSPESLTNMVPNPEHSTGICEYLKNENISIDESIHASAFEGLDILPTFGILGNPTRYLSGVRFAQLLKELKKRYTTVIVDTPAVLPIVDTPSIVNLADTVIMVVQANKTNFKEIKTCQSRFQHSGSRAHGIILNGVKDMKRENFYGYQLAKNDMPLEIYSP
jgi:capsular exopolysaccharide synthesis family protein